MEYRLYTIGGDGHIDSPPKVFVTENDEEAIRAAQPFVDGHLLELWEGGRLVAKLSPHKNET